MTSSRVVNSVCVTFMLLCGHPRLAGAAERSTQLFTSKSKSNPLANDPRRVEREGVFIVVDSLDASRSQDVFGIDLLKRKIQPLVVKVYNGSEHVYQLRKADVQPAVLPASTVARLLKDPILSRTAQASRDTIAVIPRTVFPHANKPPTRLARRETVQANVLHDELADGAIKPKQFVNGFLFIPAATATPLTLTLTSDSAKAPLIIQIPSRAAPSP